MSKAVEEKKNEEVTVQEVETEEVKRPYTLRNMRDDDLFPLLQLFRSIGLKEFRDAWKNAKKNNKFESNESDSEDDKESAIDRYGEDIFLDIADIMISKIETHKNEIYGFYERLSGIPADEIKGMEFGTLPLMIYDSFSGVKNTAFFKVLFKLL